MIQHNENLLIIDDFRKTCLSNFYPVNITFGEYTFPTSEHLYMSFKSSPDEYVYHCEQLLSNPSPWHARKYGTECIKIKDIEYWDSIKYEVMENVIRLKFDHTVHLNSCISLVNTYPALLVEGNNWHDNYWGVCYCDKCKDIKFKQNNLGLILMERRSELMRINSFMEMYKNKGLVTF